MWDIKSFLANLPHHPGVYQMLGDNNEVLYVGKAKNLKNRISSYFNKQIKEPKTQLLVKQIKNIDITTTETENAAVLLECNLIKKHQPRYNILLRDDKSYPYIMITTQNTFPRIDIYRGTKKGKASYFGPYPSAMAVREAIQLLQKLFLLRTCQDSYFNNRTRPCLLYQINRCSAPCVNYIAEADYHAAVKLAILFLQGKNDILFEKLRTQMEEASSHHHYEEAAYYRDQINRLRQIQDKQYVSGEKGNADIIVIAEKNHVYCVQWVSVREGQWVGSRAYFPVIPLQATSEEVLAAFITQHYLSDISHIESIPAEILVNENLSDEILISNVLSEQIKKKIVIIQPKRGDKKKWLEMALASAKESLAAHLFNKTNMQERMQALQVALSLPQLPARLECFDISHSHGEATVASCVVFNEEGPVKNAYRRYNIEGIAPGDDPAAMRLAIHRRFAKLQKEGVGLPDVLLIDGGQTQLHAALTALKELNIDPLAAGCAVIAVSKGPLRKPGLELLHRENQPSMHLPPDSHALHLIQQIRDEAHRFAVLSHRMRRDKTRRHSVLEEIPGIGAHKRRALLNYFGGIQGVFHASLDEIAKVPGVNRALAERIFEALRAVD